MATPSVRRRERGLVIPMVAIVLTVLITFTSIAVDIGFVRVVRRDMQALADVMALDLSRRLDGRPPAQIEIDPAWQQAKADSLARNLPDLSGRGTPAIQVELGQVDSVTGQFGPVPDPNTNPATAVKVTATGTVDYFFRPGSKTTTRSAVAAHDAKAQFSVGSFLASVDPTEINLINQLFRRLGVRSNGVQLLSYNDIAGGSIGIRNLDASIRALYPNGGASTTLTQREWMLLTADALTRTGDPGDAARAAALRNGANDHNDPAIQSTLDAPTTLTLGELGNAYLQGADAVGGGSVNLTNFATSSLLLMDGTNVVRLTGTDFNLAGLGDVEIEARVVNGPVISRMGRVGTTAENTQVELRIRPTFTYSDSTSFNLATCTSLLLENPISLSGIVCLTASLSAVVQMSGTSEIVVRAARAQGTLSAIDCDSTPGITVTPTILEAASLASNWDFTMSASLLGRNLGNVMAVHVAAASVGTTGSGAAQRFDDPSQFNQPRSVGASPLGLANLVQVGSASVSVVGVNLGPTAQSLLIPRAQNILNNRIGGVNGALARIDSVLTSRLEHVLGIRLGGADLTALQRLCDGVALVG